MRSTYTILIEGLNLHHVLAFFGTKTQIKGLVQESDHRLKMTLKKADFERFKASTLYHAYTVTILSQTGAKPLLYSLAKHLGLILGVVFMFCLTLNLTSHIYSVEIVHEMHNCQNGENCIFTPQNQSKILALLEENGVKKGRGIHSLPSSRDIEKLLMQNFENISGASLERRGVKVYLTIFEGQLPAEKSTSDLVASRSGIVISADVVSGQQKVNIGDIVLEGDVLVSPEGDAPVTATIVLRTFYHEITIFSEEQVSYRRTGRQTTKHSLKLFSAEEKDPKSPYKLYECEVKRSYVFYNLFVPLITKSTTYYELEEVVTNLSYKDAAAELKTKLEEKTRATLSPLAEEKNVTFAEYKEGSRVRLDCYIEAYLIESK